MEVILKKMGNSTALVLPPPVLRDLGIAVGQKMTLITTANGQITLSPKRQDVLAEMIARCNLKAPPPANMAPWDSARPVGQEVF
jgi:antitoxin ChpS